MAATLSELQLPSYTAERYYLLSELEQAASFTFLDEPPSSQATPAAQSQPSALTSSLLPTKFYYVLWVINTVDAATFLERLNTLLTPQNTEAAAASPVGSCSRMLAVEVLLTDRNNWRTNGDLASIERVYEKIKSTSAISVGHVIFGLADHISGTAALEALHDCIRLIRKNNSGNYPLEIIIPSRDELLGHDATREPDAEAGVSQLLLYSLPSEASSWLLDKEPHGSAHKLNTTAVSGHVNAFLFVVVAVAVALFYWRGTAGM